MVPSPSTLAIVRLSVRIPFYGVSFKLTGGWFYFPVTLLATKVLFYYYFVAEKF